MPFVRDGLGKAGGVVLHFLFHHVVGLFHLAAGAEFHRMGRATIRSVRRHHRHIRRHRDGTRPRCPRAPAPARRKPRWEFWRRRNFSDNLRSGINQSAGRVELDDEAPPSFWAVGDVNRAGDVAGRGRADGVPSILISPTCAALNRHAQEDSDHRDETPVPHKFSDPIPT